MNMKQEQEPNLPGKVRTYTKEQGKSLGQQIKDLLELANKPDKAMKNMMRFHPVVSQKKRRLNARRANKWV
jgi:hypothetical protein